VTENKNAVRLKVKLNIKGKQQHPSNFYFSKYKVSTMVNRKSFALGRSGSENAQVRSTGAVSYVLLGSSL